MNDKCTELFDSVWERDFKWILLKYLPENYSLHNQHPFCEAYRADFVIKNELTGELWVYEVDGRTYHDYEKDKRRDDRILAMHPEVRSITRIDAKTSKMESDITRDILSKLTPNCFSRPIDAPDTPKWEKSGDKYQAWVFDYNHDPELWHNEEGSLMNGAPMLHITVIHRAQNS